MEEEPPVTSETPETPENPETPTPEDNDSTTEESPASPENPETPTTETSHATRNTVIIVVVIVVVIAVVLALFFGLRGCNNDEPDEVNPDPDIVEPGPVEDPDDDDGEEEDLIPSSMIVTGDDDLVVYYNNDTDSRTPITLDLRDTLTVTVLDQFGNEYTGPYGGSEYRLSTKSSEYITLSAEGVVTAVSEGTATVTVTSVANSSLTEDIEIEVSEREFCDVESISISLGGQTIDDENILLDWGATSGELEVTFTPSDATVQTYEVTSQYQYSDVLFTYNETTNTFTHTKLNTGTQTFVITATDQSYNASATITLECDPVIDEPYEVVWKNDPSLPETIAKGNSITNLDQYVEVHYHHEDQDPNEYEDDTYTLSFAGSDGVTIDGTKATFTGSGGTETYITVTATPEHDTGNPVYAQSSDIVITQAVTIIDINYSEYMFKPLKSDTSVDLEVIFYPEDAYPLPEEQITWTVTDDSSGYINVTPNDEDSSQCEVSLAEGAKEIDKDQYIESTVVASVGNVSARCNIIISTYDFATDSWETINEVSSRGIANKVYDVGDTKTINIGIEDEAYQEHEIRIIDFNHDDLTNTDDNGYGNESYNGGSNKAAITVEMVDCLCSGHAINVTNQSTEPYNTGGWAACDMRSYLNSDSGCVLSTLDNDLQSVIKRVDKKANGGYQSSGAVTSSDSLFLLSYVELGGNGNGGSSTDNEGSTTYEYWSEHSTPTEEDHTYSDRFKYKPNGSDPVNWWTRTASTSEIHLWYYCDYTDGKVKADNTTARSYAVSFAFCI